MNRRSFLRQTGMLSMAFMGLHQYAYPSEWLEKPGLLTSRKGYGPLQRDPLKMLELPKHFSYQIISRQGDLMDDGLDLPGKPDGMAAFPGPDGKTILVRNHEVGPEMLDQSPFGRRKEKLGRIHPSLMYDRGRGILPCLGGTTTLLYNPRSQEVEHQFMSLAGTSNNCAGGPTPWRSWISCEETTIKSGRRLEKNHGYAFEVPATLDQRLTRPAPIKAMGRFRREAVGVDPRTSIVYQTEDREDAAFYRFIPNRKGDLHSGGRLQVLSILGHPSVDTRNWKELPFPSIPEGEKLKVLWQDIDQIDSLEDDLRLRAFKQGAARFARSEGIWFGEEEAYIACTTGGKRKLGQIFRYRPSPYEGTNREFEEPGTLELFIESNHAHLLQHCDNLTMAPTGDLVVCEDCEGTPRIVGITPKGQCFAIARNIGYQSEFAGATFSPDGTTLFVNIQHAGLTLAITGPWFKKEIE
ncbi:MAG: alkaline phosphatase PhoX [Bacteroidota bacterium]